LPGPEHFGADTTAVPTPGPGQFLSRTLYLSLDPLYRTAMQGNGDYAKALGLEMDASGFGMGTRGQRFAIIVQDGVAKNVDIEEKGQFKVSSAEHILSQL